MAAAALTGARRGLALGKQKIRTAECERSRKVEKHAAERKRRNSQRASTLLAQYASDTSECSTNDSDEGQYLGHAEVERMLGDLTAHLLEATGDNAKASCLPTVEDIEFLFNLCDRRCGNNNGKIDEDEIIPVCDAWTAYLERATQIAWLLSRFDSNRDGKIDSEELRTLLEELSCGDEVPEEVTRWVLKEADLGGDGALSAMELARGLCAFYRWRDKDDPRSKMLRVSRLIERDSSLPPPPPRPSGNSGPGAHPLCGGPCSGGEEDSCIPRELGAQVTRAAHSAGSGSGPGVHGACCTIS
mmetsp:Transcript_43900/g.78942  ORF Transcript_43900/g.78942 Transcript_43900/m.78942 type:complete len:301 (+) Transcript_43900:62-964(+)